MEKPDLPSREREKNYLLLLTGNAETELRHFKPQLLVSISLSV